MSDKATTSSLPATATSVAVGSDANHTAATTTTTAAHDEEVAVTRRADDSDTPVRNGGRSKSSSSDGGGGAGATAGGACRHAAAHDDAALSSVSPALLQSARDIVTRTFDAYALHAIGVAFNGGKDCVVMTELLRETVGLERLRRCCFFVLEEAEEFRELAQFREHYVATRLPGATLHHIDAHGDLCAGLWDVKRRFAIDAVFIGTRRSDPDGKYQATPCSPTTAGWPPMMRVCPVLDWDYRDVWSYILTHDVPYCTLYSHGYTSLGHRDCTTPHDDLRNDDGSYCPAWHLDADAHERDGRV